MSLRYIIDGCNVVHHPEFIKIASKKSGDSRAILIEILSEKKLCGSSNNFVWVVFDGYPCPVLSGFKAENLAIIFSCDRSADDKIREILELAGNASRNIIVVSDDREVSFFSRGYRARTLKVDEFIRRGEKRKWKESDDSEGKLGFSAMNKINEELRKLWLK